LATHASIRCTSSDCSVLCTAVAGAGAESVKGQVRLTNATPQLLI
jgi:hypothetical protein